MAAIKKRAIDILSSSFDLNQRRKYQLIVDEVHVMDLYFKSITRADRLEVQSQAGTDDAMKISTHMLVKKAENEDGSHAFSIGDIAALRRLPEKILNEIELFLFAVDKDGEPLDIEEAKKD